MARKDLKMQCTIAELEDDVWKTVGVRVLIRAPSQMLVGQSYSSLNYSEMHKEDYWYVSDLINRLRKLIGEKGPEVEVMLGSGVLASEHETLAVVRDSYIKPVKKKKKALD